MRIDYEYLAEVLKVFLDAEEPTVTWNEFIRLHEEDDGPKEKKLIFHLELLADRALVVSDASDGNLGIRRNGDGSYRLSIVPWRLTADGHDFASSLTKPGILKTIVTKFAKEGLDVTKSLVTEIAKQQAAGLLGGG